MVLPPVQQLENVWEAWLAWVDVRKPFTRTTFIREFIPLALFYILMSLCVILPNTRYLRMTLCPIALYAFVNAAVHWDVTGGDPRSTFMNQNIVVFTMMLGMRVIIWTFQKVPYQRIGHPNSSPLQTFYNCMDLTYNTRGVGWDWAAKYTFPPETRPLDPSRRSTFLFQTLLSGILHLYIGDFLQFAAASFEPNTIGSLDGGTIFDASLALPIRLLRAWTITVIAGTMIYASMTAAYNIFAFFCILALRQEPEQWPPMYDAPWFATSLSEMWGKKWHALFRQTFVEIGAKPLAYLTGSRLVGGCIGAFTVSALLHHFALWGMGRGFDLRMPLFYIMMGVGTILEGLWRKTGGKVGGIAGWSWTMGWCVVWGALMIDVWTLRGLVANTFLPEEIRIAGSVMGMLTRPKTYA